MGSMLRVRFILLVAVVAVIGHDLTYLVAHGLGGYRAALGTTGHDGHWLPVAAGVGALLLAAASVAAARWVRLRRQLAQLPGDPIRPRMDPILPPALRLAARLFVTALVVFIVQENLEATAMGAMAPGPGIVVASGYAAAVPALAVVALLFAITSELIDARILRLEHALAVARTALPRPTTSAARRVPRLAHRRASRGRSQPDLGRAPPASAHA